MEISLSLLALLILLPLSAFFSGSEIAIFSIPRLHLKRLVSEGRRNVHILSDLHENPEKTLSAILLGNTLVNVGASFFASLIVLRLAVKFGISEEAGTVLSILGMTLILLVFGELTPKLYSAERKEFVALKVAPLLKGILFLFSPILFLLNLLLIPVRLIRKEPSPLSRSVEELKTMIEMSLESGDLKLEEARMIRRVFDLSGTPVKKVMTPRVKAIALSSSATIKDAITLLSKKTFSRIPVYHGTLDHILGILNVRDLLPHLSTPEREISSFLRAPYIVPETTRVGEFLTGLEKNSSHIGIIVDEYGGTSGLVTLDDLFEEVVGEILEEEDRKELPLVSPLAEGEVRVLGNMDLHHLNELLGTDLPTEFAVTLAGFLYDLAGKIPAEGESYLYEGITFTIEEVVERRIVRVKICKDRK